MTGVEIYGDASLGIQAGRGCEMRSNGVIFRLSTPDAPDAVGLATLQRRLLSPDYTVPGNKS